MTHPKVIYTILLQIQSNSILFNFILIILIRLVDSLGGNSKTIMVATVRTDLEYYQQTAITLKYASRAKKVRTEYRMK